MVLAVVRKRMREGRKPDRDIVLAFTADEEAGGNWGAKFLVEEHPDLFEGVTEAIGEVGGFSVSVGDERMYAVQTAEKGLAWMRLTATGTAGHGSMIHSDNAITALAAAVARVGQHQWPTQLPDATRAFLDTGKPGPGRRVRPAGPGQHHRQARRDEQDDRRDHPAHREPDRPQGRLQGQRDPADGERGPRRALPARPRGRVLRRHSTSCSARQSSASSSTTTSRSRPPPTVHLWDAMAAALNAEDPDGIVVPYCLSAGTDAKWFSKLGIRCFGFSPLQLPPQLDFAGMFHGIDERVPVDGLTFGVRVLDRLLETAA